MLVRAENKGWEGTEKADQVQYSRGETGIFHVFSCNENVNMPYFF